MAEIGENSTAKIQLAFAAKVIGIVGTIVWGYSVIVNRLNTIENDIIRIQHELELNTEFRIKWPRGELGALPADSRQDLRLDIYEKEIDKLKTIVDELRFETTH